MMSMVLIMLAVFFAVVLLLLFAIARLNRRANAVLVRPDVIDAEALADEELQSYLPDNKIHAIKRYRELTGVGLKEAKDVIDWAIRNPVLDAKLKGLRKTGTSLRENGADFDMPGIRDLVAEGRIEEAIKVYAAFMGVDAFSARDAIAQILREIRLDDASDAHSLADLLTDDHNERDASQ